jgi:hypothetical protein
MTIDIVTQVRDTNQQLFSQLEAFDEIKLNKVPYMDSWTAAQVANHLVKSDRFLLQLLMGPTRETTRQTDAQVQQLADTFLNFDTRLKSPGMIIPDDRAFTKQEVLTDLKTARTNLLEAADEVDLALTTTIESPLRESTLLELLHFHLYHTKRHLHQLEKIKHAVSA